MPVGMLFKLNVPNAKHAYLYNSTPLITLKCLWSKYLPYLFGIDNRAECYRACIKERTGILYA